MQQENECASLALAVSHHQRVHTPLAGITWGIVRFLVDEFQSVKLVGGRWMQTVRLPMMPVGTLGAQIPAQRAVANEDCDDKRNCDHS